ncbi:MAG: hypothetical protein ACLPKB_02695 [Xanthobacteraceae bacterium]
MTKPDYGLRVCVARPATLFDLQEILDRLAPGEQYKLNELDYERLFGIGTIARDRLNKFAAVHDCAALRTDSAVAFQKLASP